MDPLQRYFTYKWLLEVDDKSVGYCVDHLSSLDPVDRCIANQEQPTELSQVHIEHRHSSWRKRQRGLSEESHKADYHVRVNESDVLSDNDYSDSYSTFQEAAVGQQPGQTNKLPAERCISTSTHIIHPIDEESPRPAIAKLGKGFEKRARHKTRHDRYEPKAQKQEESKERRSDKGKKRRSARKSCRKHSLIGENFSASSVKQNRLTVNPNDKLGIFRKGKTSSPVKPRELPDFTFSEMKFLSKSAEDDSKGKYSKDDTENKKLNTEFESQKQISKYFERPGPQNQNNHHKLREAEQCELVPKSLVSTLPRDNRQKTTLSMVQQQAPDEFGPALPIRPLRTGCTDGIDRHSPGVSSKSAPYTWSETSQGNEGSDIDPSLEAYVGSLLFDGLYSRNTMENADVLMSSKIRYDLEDLKAISESREKMRKLKVCRASPNNANTLMWSQNRTQSVITSAEHGKIAEKSTIDVAKRPGSLRAKSPYQKMPSNREHAEPLISACSYMDHDRPTWNMPSVHGNEGSESLPFSHCQSAIHGDRLRNLAYSEHPTRTKHCSVWEESIDYLSGVPSCGGNSSVDLKKGYTVGHAYSAGSMIGVTEDQYQGPLMDTLAVYDIDHPETGNHTTFNEPHGEKSIHNRATSCSSLVHARDSYNVQSTSQSNADMSYGAHGFSRPLSHSLQHCNPSFASFVPPIGFHIRPANQLLPSWCPSPTIEQSFRGHDYLRSRGARVSSGVEGRRSDSETPHTTESSYIPVSFWRQNKLY